MSRPLQRRPQHVPKRPGATVIRRPAANGHGPGAISRGTATPNAKNDEGFLYVAGVKDPSKRMVEYWNESDTCPSCQTDRQFEKGLRLLVSPCYHKLCTACIDRLFTLGPETCPSTNCTKVLRKANFAHQTFEDLKVEKEVSVRRRINEIYNKREADFPTRRAYDDYLQEVEDITFNLLNEVDVSATEAKIAAYQNENASLITTNKHKAAMESMSAAERDEVEKRARAERARMIEEAERVERAEDERVKAEIVDALSRQEGGEALAKEIRGRHARAKSARAAALAAAVPPSLALLAKDEGPAHSPNSPAYAGPYVPIPYNDPDTAPWAEWYNLRDEYADGRAGVVKAREDKEKTYRAGGWDVREYWELEVRCAIESLCIEPLE
ncbi:hypothetical protein CcaverHIS002_0602130 [Cutaneotrichosporon cavernicola]|uniref:RNA polymerase II transcription factor B subunit 3 n=1 Tax=Cutaneotrichosporon cavernicola TaxID=279322 RepID=A0AA48QXM1_9TREE|nr:uncharacterized protein CcaverHIS019_0601630 [Cutaneotrichosporon cavernicola]BEI85926.1 hypothetical protein CcaverHIS002_0602130 [Cutaneotrichosporon cavernicola]BEI93704.1 hypothetical protein CcaverHIS019_0601630 [Cutaneotrichosporon cavernicola]BEJ01481.1 hypothetical protein CcaverHIS631_0601630 [Cutaneotrichosporon cavernicola]BEJ09247.1 hypothetical protein CcaverHIS641_0601620 [Cutaneotrichosporon cavernicola]